MALKFIREFKQGALIKNYEVTTNTKLPTPGICFRVTFKWAACALYDAPFKYDQLNVVKTANKHVEYRQKTLAYSNQNPDWTDNKVLQEYVDLDAKETLDFTNRWGVTIKDGMGTVYNGLFVQEQLRVPIWEDILKSKSLISDTIIMTFYGRKNNNGTIGPAGHAVGFCGKQLAFFDANTGLWNFTDPSPAAVAKDIETYIARGYKSFTHDHFNLLRLNTLMLPSSMLA